MPYKDKKKQLACQRAWYKRNWPKSKDMIVENNRRWRENNRDRANEINRNSGRKCREEKKEEGRCPRCGCIIDNDEKLLYNQIVCEACNTKKRSEQRMRRKGMIFNRVV